MKRQCTCGNHSPGGECEACRQKHEVTLQRAAISASPVSEVPPIVHEVLRSPGKPLDPGTRAFMEPRFGHDFSGVRVHSDVKASESARAVDALAYTVDKDVVFGAGQYAPQTSEGKRLLAHELTHVVQQNLSLHSTGASEAFMEAEATEAAQVTSQGKTSEVSKAANKGSIQFVRRTINGREFEIGDVQLNQQASVDVRTHGVLFPGPDQGHIVVTGDRKIGYEISNTNPDDPFRWQHFKDIVDNGHVDIFAVSSTQRIQAKEISGGPPRIVNRTLLELGFASGITLPRLAQQRAIEPTRTIFVASPDDNRDRIYYESGSQGRGMLGSNSLAHEFFGHLWLAVRGVPFQHGRQLTAQHGITDPMGRNYVGSVNEYIERFAGASGTALESPTQRVNTAFLDAALRWMMTQGASGLTLDRNGIGHGSNDFGLTWEVISGNYEILLVGPQPSTATPSLQSAAGVLNWVLGWFNTSLNDSQKRAFRSILVGITTTFSSSNSRRTRLAQDVLNRLPRNP